MNGVNLFAAFLGAVGIALVYSVIAGGAEGILARLGGRASQRVARWAKKDTDPYRLSMLKERPFLDRLLGALGSSVTRWLGTAERDAAVIRWADSNRPGRGVRLDRASGFREPGRLVIPQYQRKVDCCFWNSQNSKVPQVLRRRCDCVVFFIQYTCWLGNPFASVPPVEG